ncbi:MAG: polysaccharide deacetylase family protein [Bacteroidetes bacterium]|nr:MAG: polysaccharide deacetylase family protein [Bacteroidota bacterium]
MYLSKMPRFIQDMFPAFHWRVDTDEPVLYLTFDDGPVPEVTPWVLDTLAAFQARATFFCVGANVVRYPELIQRILSEGHAVGSHTFHHLSGWASENDTYFQDVRRCARLLGSDLFRPPYGRIKPAQAKFLQRHYRIVMWDVLSGDFDTTRDGNDCYRQVARHAGPGSIVVFHDSVKAEPRLREALPRVLEHFAEKGYRFEALTSQALQGQKEVMAHTA